jgi:hypothetical protein
MKTIGIKLLGLFSRYSLSGLRLLGLEATLLFSLLLSLWLLGNRYMQNNFPLSGSLDPNIFLLILLSLICFLSLTALCWLMLHRIWMSLRLPSPALMVSQFNTLALWQQLGFYCFCFALFLLSAVGCLIAIC